jgi:O-methyltransferase
MSVRRFDVIRRLKQGVGRIPLVGSVAKRIYGTLRPSGPKGYYSEEVGRHLHFGVEYVYYGEVEGDVAEFGTMSGDTSVALAQAMSFCRDLGHTPKKLHLFDSFEGLPAITSKVDAQSQHVLSGAWGPGGCKMLGKAELLARLQPHLAPERLVVHHGWYRDTVPKLPRSTRFGLVHVDCDLYQSTMDALEPLFANGHLAEGALILFDDWNCNRASPAHGERRAWAELASTFSIVSSDLGGYSWDGHKFIVHSYKRKQAR